ASAGGNTATTLEGRQRDSYLGYPIITSQVLPTSQGTLAGEIMLYFGDLSSAAAFGDRGDARIFPSEHRFMDTDQIGVHASQRFHVNVHDVGDTTAAGPIVALVGG
ncbi:MAG: phage major capsid protein, partial [Planctomycetia bacterium]